MTNSSVQSPQLQLVDGGRDALEREAVRIAAGGTNAEIKAMVDRLKPQGRLSLAENVAASDATED